MRRHFNAVINSKGIYKADERNILYRSSVVVIKKKHRVFAKVMNFLSKIYAIHLLEKQREYGVS